jgi:hypothetical protein
MVYPANHVVFLLNHFLHLSIVAHMHDVTVLMFSNWFYEDTMPYDAQVLEVAYHHRSGGWPSLVKQLPQVRSTQACAQML